MVVKSRGPKLEDTLSSAVRETEATSQMAIPSKIKNEKQYQDGGTAGDGGRA